jgi:two-component system LytT family response regulator
MTYSALIVDDEQDNINLLSIYLKKHFPNVTICDTATNVAEGIESYYEHYPDILFLDIRLGDEESFSIIESLSDLTSEIIIVSSHEEYALKAISYDVCSYVLKPIVIKEFIDSVNKAIKNINQKQGPGLDNSGGENRGLKLIALPSLTKIELISMDEVIYAEADGRYTLFHLITGKTIISTRNLGEFEKKLDSVMFFRIHHGYIVNLSMVRNINISAGNYCEMMNDKMLPIAKRRKEKLQKFLKLK